MSEFQFSTVDEALEDLKNGKIILVAECESISEFHFLYYTICWMPQGILCFQ